ncbi:MAG: hypothetical protein CM1200mP32_12590 [Methanobacteriota archaeon]|nr:MAG: hypothetical protein CM1200mP32_12590 [Euryarchaeota archaeon]
METLALDLGGAMSNIGGTTPILLTPTPDRSTRQHPSRRESGSPGLPRLHVDVSTTPIGGQIYALMEDCDGAGQCIHLGHAIMDLRYHEGGTEEQVWIPLLQTINAKMEFFTIDAYVGRQPHHQAEPVLHWDDYLPAAQLGGYRPGGTGSTLQLDIIDPADKLWFDPPTCMHSACLDWLNPTADLT